MQKAIINREPVKYEDITTFKNANQKDKRNYIAIRVFANQFKDEKPKDGGLKHHSLERVALEG